MRLVAEKTKAGERKKGGWLRHLPLQRLLRFACPTQVARGYQVRLEFSDAGTEGPWQLYWLFEGSDVERVAFDSFDSSVMRMYRILPPEPLDYTYPW